MYYKKLQQLSDDLYNSIESGAHLTLHHIKYHEAIHWENWVSDPTHLNKNKKVILRKIWIMIPVFLIVSLSLIIEQACQTSGPWARCTILKLPPPRHCRQWGKSHDTLHDVTWRLKFYMPDTANVLRVVAIIIILITCSLETFPGY